MYNNLLANLKKEHQDSKIKSGLFGSCMEVQINNDGPVTIQIESNKKSSSEEI